MAEGGIIAQEPYLRCIQSTLEAALCLANFPSQQVERHNKPEVEVQQSPELLLNPIVISRDKEERVLIETSVNSVRVSIKIRKEHELDVYISRRFMDFLSRRAHDYYILRRKPVTRDGVQYDMSILITNDHYETMLKDRLIDWVIQFMKDIDKEIKDMKLGVNMRARIVAKEWFNQFPK
eukprot:TRINITY_DN1669_c0_g2_i1.p1 TRINITY_DN1669_c0_g2~~TRINITY_DN1669_c0_g2_i1.p1  ORF type:complete len:179 (+),score=52.34 TRINITY_DN1669_c0_g2_i1:103-639(+)